MTRFFIGIEMNDGDSFCDIVDRFELSDGVASFGVDLTEERGGFFSYFPLSSVKRWIVQAEPFDKDELLKKWDH